MWLRPRKTPPETPRLSFPGRATEHDRALGPRGRLCWLPVRVSSRPTRGASGTSDGPAAGLATAAWTAGCEPRRPHDHRRSGRVGTCPGSYALCQGQRGIGRHRGTLCRRPAVPNLGCVLLRELAAARAAPRPVRTAHGGPRAPLRAYSPQACILPDASRINLQLLEAARAAGSPAPGPCPLRPRDGAPPQHPAGPSPGGVPRVLPPPPLVGAPPPNEAAPAPDRLPVSLHRCWGEDFKDTSKYETRIRSPQVPVS